ncbi:unnamed protein product [Closterium sp. Naga37s-1]|nr:unnamed protein product [Closterium sp. Naga37s-1]
MLATLFVSAFPGLSASTALPLLASRRPVWHSSPPGFLRLGEVRRGNAARVVTTCAKKDGDEPENVAAAGVALPSTRSPRLDDFELPAVGGGRPGDDDGGEIGAIHGGGWAPRVYHHEDLYLSDLEKNGKGKKKGDKKKKKGDTGEEDEDGMEAEVAAGKAESEKKEVKSPATGSSSGSETGSSTGSEGKKKSKKEKEKSGRSRGVEPTGHYPDDLSSHAKAAEKDKGKKKKNYNYEDELERLQLELVKLQEWIKKKGLRVVVIFEGRDAAGKGGIIKVITAPLNPRVCSIKALGTPSDRERTQWYFQRYVAHLPAAGEMVLFDRSWYNRAGVERVMGFCSDEEYREFLRSCPEFERMLVRSGIILVKYWISVSPEEQEKRFKERLDRPEKRWKLSDMDLQSRARWADYSYAKDVMFGYCDIKQAPWYVVPSDDKKAARLSVMAHLLSLIPYEDLIEPNDVKIPPLQEDYYVRPPVTDQTFVPQLF